MVFRKSGNAVPKATIHKILHNRIYTGDFDFDGKTYRGAYEPIITTRAVAAGAGGVSAAARPAAAEAEARLRLLGPDHAVATAAAAWSAS